MSKFRFAPFIVTGLFAALTFGQQPLKLQPGAEQPPAAKTATKEEEEQARQALAERFFDSGTALDRQYTSKAMLRQAEAFYAAASALNPTEPRYVRYLAQAKEKEADTAGAIKAWRSYLALPSPAADDQVAQVSLIDLYLVQQQGDQAKVAYLKQILANPRVGVKVKAYVAMRAVSLLDQRSRKEALEMLAAARGYYPLAETTLLENAMLPPEATRVQRLAALLNILRANPVHVDSIGAVADMLSDVGLSEEALIWYASFIEANVANGTLPNHETLVNYLAERYRAGESTMAMETLEKDIDVEPDNPNFWFLRLTIKRDDESKQLLKEAEQAFLRRLNIVCEAIVPEQVGAATRPSATQPTTSPTTLPATQKAPTTQGYGLPPLPAASQPVSKFPIVTADAIPLDEAIRRVKASDDAGLKKTLAEVLYDLTWFEVYFNHDAKSAERWLAATKQLALADDVKLKRLEGWCDFVGGKTDLARAIFTAQKDSDPLSALGLFDLELQQKHDKQVEEIGQQILSEPGSGVVAAILFQATRGRGFKALKQPADAPAILAELQKFPREWLNVVHDPSRAYAIRADPAKVGHHVGEAFLADVTIQNVGKMDVTIGNFGLVKPLLVLDGQIRGVNARNFPGAAIDRIMGRLVLAPGESITQTIRLDEGEFSDALRSRPGVILLVNADVMTNAASTPEGFRARAGGNVRLFSRMFTRVSTPLVLDKSRRDLIKDLHEGPPADKMLDVDLLTAYVTQYLAPDAGPAERAYAAQFANLIDGARGDSSPSVKLWAGFSFSLLMGTPDERTKAVDVMLKSNAWESRLLGLYAAHPLGPEVEKQLASKLAADDSNELVKFYARATLEVAQAAATAPATAPTTAPATAPATAPTTRPSTFPAQ